MTKNRNFGTADDLMSELDALIEQDVSQHHCDFLGVAPAGGAAKMMRDQAREARRQVAEREREALAALRRADREQAEAAANAEQVPERDILEDLDGVIDAGQPIPLAKRRF